MILSYTEAVQRGIPFYDEAIAGHFSAVPCWPVDRNGDAVDCEAEALLVGVLSLDGLFKAEEEATFDPRQKMRVCVRHGGMLS